MANLETEILDKVIVNTRRKMLAMGGTALAGMLLASSTKKAEAATFSDADILNFALNLEYLEANFYYLAAFGCTIENAGSNTAAKAAGAPALSLNGGVTVTGTGIGSAAKVPFGTTASEIAIASYCNETAVEEGKHVLFLQTALGTSTAVAQPLINLGVGATDAWPTVASAALIPGGSAFNPYLNSTYFLLGAYVFEDVGVTAYHGAASLLTSKAYLAAAAGILGVEAYHAGLIRTTITVADQTSGATGTASLGYLTGLISTLRASLAKKALLGVTNASVTLDPDPDDFGTSTFGTASIASFSNQTATRIVDADTTDTVNPIPLAIAFSRNTSQVLNIVTGGGATNTAGTAAVSPAKGVFFPNGLNGNIK